MLLLLTVTTTCFFLSAGSGAPACWVMDSNEPSGRDGQVGRTRDTVRSWDDLLDLSEDSENEVQLWPNVSVSAVGQPFRGRWAGSNLVRADIKTNADAQVQAQTNQEVALGPSGPSDSLVAAREARQKNLERQRADKSSECQILATVSKIGTYVQRTLWEVWDRTRETTKKEDEEPDPLVETILSGVMLSAPSRTTDKLLGESEGATQSMLIQVGAAIFSLGCWLWAVFLQSIRSMIDSEPSGPEPKSIAASYRAVAVVLKLRYDETPSRLRVSITGDGMHKLVSKRGSAGQEACTHAKVMQIEHTQGILLQHKHDKTFVWFSAELPTRLCAMDRTTGENTRSVLFDQVMAVPELMRSLSPFETAIRVSTSDRYSANLRAEAGLQQEGYLNNFLHMFLPCDVHKLHTSIKNANRCSDEDVTGLVHCGLTAAELGATRTMRAILISLLETHLEIEYSEPPAGEADVFRKEIFDLHLPIEGGAVTKAEAKVHQKRRFILAYFLNGNLSSERIVHHCRRACCRSMQSTRELCAHYLVWSLVPHAIPTLSRKTWTGYSHVLSWVGVLDGHHFLFRRMMELYVGKPKAPPAQAAPSSHAPPLEGAENWLQCLLDDGNEEEEELDQQADGDAAVEHEQHEPDGANDHAANSGDHAAASADADKVDWAALKRQSKMTARHFVATDPGSRVTVLKQSLVPVFDLMGAFLRLSGVSWRRKQERLSFKSKTRSYVILEAAIGTDLSACLKSLLDQLGSPIKAVHEQNMSWNLRALRFKLVACAASAIHSLLRVPREGMPYQIFKALQMGGEHQQILEFPACMMDSFATFILEKFKTAEDLASPECQAILESMALTCSVDIAEIESRHSQTRSFCLTNPKGWAPSLESISSKFLTRFSNHPKMTPDKKRRFSKKASAKRRGGGGAWRAFVHEQCSGKRFDGQSIRKLSEEYRAMTPAEREKYVLAGDGGRLAHKSGFKAFAKRPDSAPRPGIDVDGCFVAADAPVVAPESHGALVPAAFEMTPYQGATFLERYEDMKGDLSLVSKQHRESLRLEDKDLEDSSAIVDLPAVAETESSNPLISKPQFRRTHMKTSGAAGVEWSPPTFQGVQAGTFGRSEVPSSPKLFFSSCRTELKKR